MKKRVFSLFCALMFLICTLPAASALEGEAQRSADILSALDLMDYTGQPMSVPATRLAAVTLLVRLSGADTAGAPASGFTDLPLWAAETVSYAASKGWVGGVSPNTFAPDRPVTANAWFTMLLRMLGYRDSAGEFAVSDAAALAQRVGLVSRPYAGELTRGDLVESAREFLHAPLRDGSGTVIDHLVSVGRCTQAAVILLGLTEGELTAREAADRHMAAVFCLDLYEPSDDAEDDGPSARASGFFISADGAAVTNYHTIDQSVKAVATLSTGESYEVEKVLWYDVDMDLAVIRVSRTSLEGKTTPAFAYLQVTGTSEIRAGDVVYTISNPLGMGLAVSTGVISATVRDVERYSLPCVMNTADISNGSSGGALLNVYGHVVAVTSGAFRMGNNMYLAVPADAVLSVDLSVPGKTLSQVAADQAMLADQELSEAG